MSLKCPLKPIESQIKILPWLLEHFLPQFIPTFSPLESMFPSDQTLAFIWTQNLLLRAFFENFDYFEAMLLLWGMRSLQEPQIYSLAFSVVLVDPQLLAGVL